MPSLRWPTKRVIRRPVIQMIRQMVAITDRRPAQKIGAMPTVAYFMATAFKPQIKHSTVNIITALASSLSRISSNLEVKDGSGSIQVDRIKGNVRLVDGSGDILINDIDGNLTIRDGSGGIEIKHVSRNVLIKEAGSGSVEIDGVKGKVTTWE